MKIAVIGLGKMGSAIANRLHNQGHQLFGYDISRPQQPLIEQTRMHISSTLEQLAQQVSIFWLMVPADVVDEILYKLLNQVPPQSIIIDGGNSHFTDSMRRAQLCKEKNIFFIDCGVSGGVLGEKEGFSLMIGGEKTVFLKLESVFKAIAAPQGYAYLGKSGAGHYVKMIHNGIEYALLEAYAEGFQLIKEGSFKNENLDVAQIAKVWNHGAVIRSWILELAQEIFSKDQQLKHIGGEIGEHGTGQWTVEEAQKNKIPVPVIEDSLKVRAWSRKTGGNYATKIIAMLRHAFGGHRVKKESQ